VVLGFESRAIPSATPPAFLTLFLFIHLFFGEVFFPDEVSLELLALG
jgi:hypothetical protein